MKVNHSILDFFIFDLLFEAFPADFMQTVEEDVMEYILMLAALHLLICSVYDYKIKV